MSAVAALLPDGRLHLQHGPIDCLCRAWGKPGEVRAAYGQATRLFAGVLDELCIELPILRSPVLMSSASLPSPKGPIARAMHAACLPFANRFITPMAAVAGAVADRTLAAMVEGRDLARAFVNNGGDVAFHLTPGTSLRCGLVTDIASHIIAIGPNPVGPQETPFLNGAFLLTADRPARGLATSGRACKGHGGRSFSFGIADSVSVLARTAVQADAAATVIGNVVDLPGHAAIDRRPASDIDPASDLGTRLITFDVGPLTGTAIEAALDAGETMADTLLRSGLIEGAVLALRGHLRICLPSVPLASPALLELT